MKIYFNGLKTKIIIGNSVRFQPTARLHSVQIAVKECYFKWQAIQRWAKFGHLVIWGLLLSSGFLCFIFFSILAFLGFFFHCPNTVAVRKNALSFAAKWMAPEVVLLRRSLLKELEAVPACADRGLHVESYWGHLLCFARLRNTSILHSLTCGTRVCIAICVYTYICKSHK